MLGSLFTLARSLYMLFQGTDQLIGAGGRFVATADALQAGDDFFQLHAFDQFGYGLEIAGTAAGEGYLAEPVVLNVEGDGRGANAGGLISEHNENPFYWEMTFPAACRPGTVIRLLPAQQEKHIGLF